MIGERLQEARKRRGLTQSELSRRAGMTPAAIWQIEAGQRQPAADTIIRLCRALGVSADWLLGLTAGIPEERQTVAVEAD